MLASYERYLHEPKHLTVEEMRDIHEQILGEIADDMEAKNFMYNQINTTGMFKLKDVPKTVDAQLSKNLLNVYLMGAHISSNLINKDNFTFHTLRKNK